MANTEQTRETPRDIGGHRRLRVVEFTIALIAGAVGLVMTALIHDVGASLWLTIIMGTLAWLVVAHAGAFKVAISIEDWQVLPTVAVASVVGIVGAIATDVLLGKAMYSLGQYVVSSLVTFGALSAGVLLARSTVRTLWVSGFFRTTAVIVGNEFTTHELERELRDHQQLGIDVIAVSTLIEDGSLARLVEYTRPDRVIIAGECMHSDIELASTLANASARVYVMPQLLAAETGSAWFARHQVNGFPLLRVDQKSRSLHGLAVAPAVDLGRELAKSLAA